MGAPARLDICDDAAFYGSSCTVGADYERPRYRCCVWWVRPDGYGRPNEFRAASLPVRAEL